MTRLLVLSFDCTKERNNLEVGASFINVYDMKGQSDTGHYTDVCMMILINEEKIP